MTKRTFGNSPVELLDKPALILIFLLLVCTPLRLQVSAGETTLSLQPHLSMVWGTDQEFQVNLIITDVTGLYGWEIKLYYDSSLLNGISIVEGPFLKAVGSTYLINNSLSNGVIATACTLLGNVSGVTGSGTLATISFKSEALGACILELSGTKLGSPQGQLMTHTVVNGVVEVVPPIHDVAVKNVALWKNEVAEGRSVNVSVLVANQGNRSEDFTVKLYGNDTIISSMDVLNMPAGTQSNLIFTWNTTGLLINSTYQVKAEATPVPEETDLADNVFTDGYLRITQKKHNVAVKRVTPQYTAAYEGRKINVTVVAVNKGDYPETFDVTVYYDDATIGTKNVANLPYGEERNLNFVWDTTGLTNRSYVIKATASQVPGETDVTDNTFVDGTVTLLSRGVASVTIIAITPSDQYGNPVSGFTIGTVAYFKVTVNCGSIIPEFLLLTINTYGADSVSIAVISFRGFIAPGSTAFVLGSMVPMTSAIGTGVVYADALTDWPHLGGTPYCPEMSAGFEIRRS